MLLRLRRMGYQSGRGLVTLLALCWILTAYHPCVQAAAASPDMTHEPWKCHPNPQTGGNTETPLSSEDDTCCDDHAYVLACADHCSDVSTTLSDPRFPKAHPAKVTRVPAALLWPANATIAALPPPRPDDPPSERYCILLN